jgi:putative PIN family toxin of toxin-antitoxin system
VTSAKNPGFVILQSIAAGFHIWMSSAPIEDEYASLILRRSIRRYLARRDFSPSRFAEELADYRKLAQIIEPTGEAPACRDEDDRKFLHCAVAGRADFLISSDRDLLDLGEVAGIPIIRPGEFIARCLANGWPLWVPTAR